MAIRAEANHILQSGRYLCGTGYCGNSGKAALATVFEAVYAHKDDGSAKQLFTDVAAALNLRHPLDKKDLDLCDLRGCVTVGDVASVLMQRIVVRCFIREAVSRLLPVARAEQGAASPLCWALSFATCTCCCLSCNQQLLAFPHSGCPCGPCCIDHSRGDVAWSDFRVGLEGIPPIVVVAIGAAWKKLVALYQPPHMDELLSSTVLDGEGSIPVNDKNWNWVDMVHVLGLGGREIAAPRQLAMRPMCSFRVVAEAGAECTVRKTGKLAGKKLKYGEIVHPLEIKGSRLDLGGGMSCSIVSGEERLLVPLTRHWEVVVEQVESFLERPKDAYIQGMFRAEHTVAEMLTDEHASEHPAGGHAAKPDRPRPAQRLREGQVVIAADSGGAPFSFTSVPPEPLDLLRVLKLGGEVVYKASWDDHAAVSELDMKGLTEQICAATGDKGKPWMLQLISKTGCTSFDSADKLIDLLPKSRSDEPLEIQIIVKLEAPLQGSWLQTEDGEWVPVFDRNGHRLMVPVPGPTPLTLADSPMKVDQGRFFFAPSEFPQLATISSQWQKLRDEALQLWQQHADHFVEFEGHDKWMACAFKLWGHDVQGNLAVAPVAAQVMQAAGVDMLTTFCYSILKPGCHIHPHEEHQGTTGVRAHLGLKIPEDCSLRVGPYAHVWREGEWTIFNGSRSHEVVNAGLEERVVLLIDFGGPTVDPDFWPDWMQGALHRAESRGELGDVNVPQTIGVPQTMG